jgi:hypothetical protein
MKLMKTISLISCSIFAIQLAAQPVITHQIFPIAGNKTTMYVDTTPPLPGSAGSNLTWNFSGLDLHYPVERFYKTPSSTTYSSDFPNATLVRTDAYNYGLSYWNVSSTQAIYYGFIETGVASQQFNDNPVVYYKFPMTYGMTYADNLTAFTMPGALTGYGVYNFVADGWGTVQLPGRTISNCLRTKSTMYIGDSTINSYSLTNEYSWFSQQYKEPVLVIVKVVINGILYYNYAIYNNLMTSDIVANGTKKIQIFPNPSTSEIFIDGIDNMAEAHELIITDISGKIVHVSDPQSNDLRIDISSLSSGMYILQVRTNTGIVTEKFLKR